MSDDSEKLADLQRENELLRRELAELRATCDLSPRERLLLEVVSRVPFSVWVCDIDCNIVLWEGAASKIYGYDAEDVIGKDFVELFVDEPEKAEARADTRAIIETDRKFVNFLASDYTSTKEELTMLTNCFRVWDAGSGQYLQAEVALEISDLESKKKAHKKLREKGLVTLVDKRQLEKTAKANAETAVREAQTLGQREIEKLRTALRKWAESLPGKAGPKVRDEKDAELLSLKDRNNEWALQLLLRIGECTTAGEVDDCQPDIESYRQWCEAPHEE